MLPVPIEAASASSQNHTSRSCFPVTAGVAPLRKSTNPGHAASTFRSVAAISSTPSTVTADRGPTPVQRGLLRATFDRTSRLGEWDFQVMGQAAQLGALVLEVERVRSQSGGRGPASAAAR